MGTRNLVCVVYKGQWVVAQYGQSDGYPEGQGLTIFHFLRTPGNLEKLIQGLSRVYYASDEEIEELEERPRSDGVAFRDAYPSLYRDTAAEILHLIANVDSEKDSDSKTSTPAENDVSTSDLSQDDQGQGGKKVPLANALTFANDSVFCEWAWVVDLDNSILEVYKGAERKHAGHRFRNVGHAYEPVPGCRHAFAFETLMEMGTEDEFVEAARAEGDISHNLHYLIGLGRN